MYTHITHPESERGDVGMMDTDRARTTCLQYYQDLRCLVSYPPENLPCYGAVTDSSPSQSQHVPPMINEENSTCSGWGRKRSSLMLDDKRISFASGQEHACNTVSRVWSLNEVLLAAKQHLVLSLVLLGLVCISITPMLLSERGTRGDDVVEVVQQQTRLSIAGSNKYGIQKKEAKDVLMRELGNPSEVRSVNGVLDIVLQVRSEYVTVGPLSFATRTYNGTIPGPTLRIAPGDLLRIRLDNLLGGETNPVVEALNSFSNPNTTNLHVHGLHVSPEGLGDNIFRACPPGKAIQYEYRIPKDHFAGMFHYHPHFHGSAALQVGGGMTGALIIDPPELVDDDNGSADMSVSSISSVKERIFVVQIFNFGVGKFRNIALLSKVSNSTLPLGIKKDPGAPVIFATVNGQYRPKISIQIGEVQLLRVLNAGNNDILELYIAAHNSQENSAETVANIGACELWVVARDGAPAFSPPRSQEFVIIGPGSRADIAISCRKSGQYRIASRKVASAEHYLGSGSDVFDGDLAFVIVEGHIAVNKEESVERILQSLSSSSNSPKSLLEETIGPENRFQLEFTQGGKVLRNGIFVTDYGINGQIYNNSITLRKSKLNQVEEWTIINRYKNGSTHQDTNHIWHMHVNHVQIVNKSDHSSFDYRVGDWRDTISIPTPGNVTIRFRPIDFVGKHVVHCHIISHCDLGMKAVLEIVP